MTWPCRPSPAHALGLHGFSALELWHLLQFPSSASFSLAAHALSTPTVCPFVRHFLARDRNNLATVQGQSGPGRGAELLSCSCSVCLAGAKTFNACACLQCWSCDQSQPSVDLSDGLRTLPGNQELAVHGSHCKPVTPSLVGCASRKH